MSLNQAKRIVLTGMRRTRKGSKEANISCIVTDRRRVILKNFTHWLLLREQWEVGL